MLPPAFVARSFIIDDGFMRPFFFFFFFCQLTLAHVAFALMDEVLQLSLPLRPPAPCQGDRILTSNEFKKASQLWISCASNLSWIQDMLRRRGGLVDMGAEEAVFRVLNEQKMMVQEKDEKHVNRWSRNDKNSGHNGGYNLDPNVSVIEAITALEEGLQPPKLQDFIACILNRCKSEKNRSYVIRLHSYMSKSGLEGNPVLGNLLVSILAELGNVSDAQEVFDKLMHHSECSWNSLITSYVRCGNSRHALELYQKMQDNDSVQPSLHAFVALLRACTELKDLRRGCLIHAHIVKMRVFEQDAFVGSTLVRMYVKCGSLAKAQEVFDKLPARTVAAWNALIAGYCQHGHAKEALNCFEHMRLEGVSPDAVSYVCSLKACSSLGDIDRAIDIHAEIAKKGLFENDLFIGTALVDMYASCGSMTKAQEVFHKLKKKSVVMWNALITGYVRHGQNEEALRCFNKMQVDGICPDATTFVCTLKACGNLGARERGQEIHIEIAQQGSLKNNILVGTTLVDMYAKCGALEKAQEVFNELPARDVVSWTALIAAYAQHGQGKEAINCYDRMQLDSVSPNAVTFISSLKACGSIGAINKGQEIHAEIARRGLLDRSMVVGNALVDMYAKCGVLGKAQEVFDKLPVQDVVVWNSLIAGYIQHGHSEQALKCFDQMHAKGVCPDAVTFVCSLKACGSIGAIDKGQEIHVEISKTEGVESNILVSNALVDMYVKCGSLAKAQQVFDKHLVRDVILWTALVAGYAQIGETTTVFSLFDKMIEEGMKPDLITFLSVLTACSHAGLVEKGEKYFESISRDYGLIPSLEHYSCMVDLLGRAGQLDKAIEMAKKMPFHPNAVAWIAALSACQKWGNMVLGRQAFEHAVHVDEREPAPYVCMSNIYSDAGMQEDANKMEIMRMKTKDWP